MVFLDLEPFESRIATEVLQVADEMYFERRKQLIEAFEAAVQNGVAKAFGGG